MRLATILVLTSGLVLLGGCGRRHRDRDVHVHVHQDGEGGLAAPGERAAERRNDRADERIEDRTGWEKLGERVVHGKADRDHIGGLANEGTFSRVMVVVEHSALELWDLELTFGDGSTFSPGTRMVFGRGTRSRIIDLPGAKRFIRKCEFRYGNLPGGGRAQVELWAR